MSRRAFAVAAAALGLTLSATIDTVAVAAA